MPVITGGAGGLVAPAVKVEIAFTNNALDALASLTWVDVSTYCLGFTTHMGRQHELNRVEASAADIRFDNRDRRFDPTNTSSPYNPNVLPMKRIRISATWAGTTYRIFTGYIESWPLSWPTVTDSEVTVHAVDALGKVLQLKNLIDPYGQAVLADAPTAWWRMHETALTQAASDTGPSGYAGTYMGAPVLNATSPVNDGTNSAVLFNSLTSDGILLPALSGISGTGAFSAEGWVNTTSPTYLYRQNTGAGGWSLSLQTTFTFQTFDASATHTLNPAGNYNDGNWHHVKASRNGSGLLTLIVDGVSIGTLAASASNITRAPVRIGNSDAPSGWSGRLAEMAIYATTEITTARALAHFQAAPAWVNDTTGTRVGRLLDAIGWPSADRTIEGGLSVLQAEPQIGSALTSLLDTADTENGLLFQGPDGKMTFFQRSHLWTTTASTVSQATFGDGAGELPYVLDGMVVALDDQDLWNDVQAQRRNGVLQEAQDTTSQGTYGTRTLSVSNMKSIADNEVLGRAQYDLLRYKNPQTRVRAFTVTPISDPTNLFPQVLGRGLWDLITFKRRPVGGGPVMTQLSTIEGISHNYTKQQGWKTIFSLSTSDSNATSYLLLDDPVRGRLDTGILAY